MYTTVLMMAMSATGCGKAWCCDYTPACFGCEVVVSQPISWGCGGCCSWFRPRRCFWKRFYRSCCDYTCYAYTWPSCCGDTAAEAPAESESQLAPVPDSKPASKPMPAPKAKSSSVLGSDGFQTVGFSAPLEKQTSQPVVIYYRD